MTSSKYNMHNISLDFRKDNRAPHVLSGHFYHIIDATTQNTAEEKPKSTENRPAILIHTDIVKSSRLTPSEKMLYIVLTMFASKMTMEADPTQETLAEITGISRRSVIRHINSMEKKNVLTVERRIDPKMGTISNLYKLNDTPSLWRQS